MIRAVFMDIDNTLLDFDAAAQEGMAHCFEDAGLIYKPEMFWFLKRRMTGSGKRSNRES